MVIKLILLTLFAIGCGREVKIPNNLESASQLSNKDLKKFQKEGTFIKGETDQIQYEGKSLTISKFSSKSSSDFIKSIPDGSQVPVIFTGGVNGSEVVIETIKRK